MENNLHNFFLSYLDSRTSESSKIRAKYPDRIPVSMTTACDYISSYCVR